MTPEQSSMHRCRAESWSNENPFRARLLSRLGGLHAPGTIATDRHVMAEEPAVELMRDLPAALTESAQEF